MVASMAWVVSRRIVSRRLATCVAAIPGSGSAGGFVVAADGYPATAGPLHARPIGNGPNPLSFPNPVRRNLPWHDALRPTRPPGTPANCWP
jgi:hypothetical protein